MEGIHAFRAIQCYSCFEWCSHYKPDCPIKHEPQACSRCGRIGHDYKICTAEPFCINCMGPHPATARICPKYTKAVNFQLPIIAQQLEHLISQTKIDKMISTDNLNTNTHTDTTLATDLLTSAALESNNKDDFLTTLFEKVQLNIKNTESQRLDTHSTLSNSISTHIEPIDIQSKHNTSLLNDAKALGNEIQYITETTKATNSNSTEHFTPPLTKHIHKYSDHQHTLTNIGIENFNDETKINLRACELKEPNTSYFTPNLVFFKTTPDTQKLITFLNAQAEISIEPNMITLLILKSTSLLFGVGMGRSFELRLNDDSSTIKHLAQWLESTYDIPLMEDT